MEKSKKFRMPAGIRNKLTAAVAMLLVSSIMMVSSTYAWFTLSTAPEVKGISTAVGANGNLEMALLPVDGLDKGTAQQFGITTGTGDSVLPDNERNVTWGNLVDVSNNTFYGMDQITLYPSQLNLKDANKDTAGNPISLPSGAILATPSYGADGRIAGMSENAQTGIFESIEGTTAFFPSTGKYGVRAVGTASGLSARELAFRNARAAGNDARALAANKAASSLSARGNSLAGIAVTLAAGGEGSYTEEDLQAIGNIISDLTVEDGVLDQIEISYMQYLVALAASTAGGTDDSAWSTIKSAVEAEGATLDSVIAKINELGADIPSELQNGITAYKETVQAVTEAENLHGELAAKAAPYTWAQISPILEKLADPNKMLVNNKTVDSIKADKQPLIDDIMGGKGITVSIATGGGVYADVADQCGDYKASIRIEGVEFQGIEIKTNATMNTQSTQTPAHIIGMAAAVEALGVPSTTTEALPMTDIFGYIIDLAFRTNAADSNLLLQPDAVDRIYTGSTGAEIKDNEGNVESTMGHGASMTFQSTNATFSENQVKNLMKAIRIVFFDPTNLDVLATAKLDVDNAQSTTDGVTAKMYLYKLTEAGSIDYKKAEYADGGTFYKLTYEYTALSADDAAAAAAANTPLYDADGGVLTYDAGATGVTYYTRTEKYVEDDTASADTEYDLYIQVTNSGEQKITDNKIMALTQNQATALSVLVYLDGNYVTNADVAATGSTSMKGTMSLQFASSATLTPMEYTPLMGQNGENSTETTTASTATDPST